MTKKRWRLAVALAAAASLMATGCSGSDSKSDGPVTLTYWDFLDPSQDNPRSKALKEFIDYMTGPKGGAVMASGGEVPTRAATYDDPFFASPDAKTVNKVAAYVSTGFGNFWALFSAFIIVAFIPVLAIFVGFQRWFITGLTSGGVKG